ncbi:hypothetical protein F5144DRAFT_582182 [Chaetomium tenue]|uniref:Uncharacterized protein n=1 Tax=Chaetomium tenue TaxID=1854479 RepID=A0ACB7P314_9PEZI|nr:hypothetical protein F5144DRAFT_582182 [Chaetomium globosum]
MWGRVPLNTTSVYRHIYFGKQPEHDIAGPPPYQKFATADEPSTTQKSLAMYALTLSAELAGVTNLRPQDTQENNFFYTFKVQCTSCRETHPNPIAVNRFENNEMSGSRGEANFVWKCKNCKRESSATIKAAPTPYEQTEPAKAQKIIEFDCRGLEFTEFLPEGEWLVDGIDSNTKFEGVELTEGEWFDYDEKAGEEVSIKDLKWDIVRA